MASALRVWVAATLLAPAAFGSLPLFFEENKGQTDRRVDFLARGSGYVLFLDDGDAVLKLKDRAVRMSLPGANRRARAFGVDALPGRSNYLRGGDGSRDVAAVAQYGKVRYESIYPGIDLVYYGNAGRLEYDFVVAPGAEPSKIRLRFHGARKVRLDREGNLLVDDGVRFDKPVLYQDYAGKRAQVAGSFRLRGREATFDVGRYRRDLPLVIDPVLAYSTYLGGSGQDYVKAIAVDGSGNAYIGGDTSSADFPVAAGSYDVNAVSRDWFVAKLNPSGTALLYATYIGAETDEEFYDLDVTPDGRAIAVGQSSLPVTAGAYNDCCSKVIRLNSSGSGIEYVASVGVRPESSFFPASRAYVKAGPDASALVAGIADADLTTTTGAYQRTRLNQDGYIVKLNSSGTAVVFATYLGGPSTDSITDIGIGESGEVFVTGTAGSGFPTTAGPLHTPGSGFAAKLKADGTALLYGMLLPGVTPQQLAVGPGGDVWIVGNAGAGFSATAGAYRTAPPPDAGYGIGCLLRLNAAGTAAVFSTYTGAFTYGFYHARISIAVDSAGDAYVAGMMTGPTTANAFQPAQGGIHVQRFNASGSVLRYATYHGSSGINQVAGAAHDGAGSLFVAGITYTANMPTTPGVLQNTIKGGMDGFVIKIDNADTVCSYTLTPTSASHTAGSGTGTVGVSANSGCSCVATTLDTWIKITSAASAVGPGTLAYSVDANPSTQPRSGTLTIAGQTFHISQAGAACTYTIVPTSLAFDAGGGVSNVAVSAPQGCAWTVSSNAAWITTAPAANSGSANVQYTVSANTGPPRTGTITTAGQVFTVMQAGTGCTQALPTVTQNAPAAGGAYSIAVTAATGCSWTAASDVPWLSITNGGTYTGSAVVQFTVATNAGAQRAGTISVAGQTFTVTQADSGCSIAVSPLALPLPSSGGTFFLNVTAGSACGWSVSTGAISWVTSSPSSGTGNAAVTLTFSANTGAARTAQLSVGQQQVTITQAAAGGCTYSLSASSTVAVASGITGTVTITPSSPNCAWRAASNVSWAQVYPLSGTGTATVSYTVYPNFGAAARAATFSLEGETFRVFQAPATGTSEERFIGEMYFAAFGRNAAPVEIQGHLSAGRTRAETVNVFLNVPEFHNAAKFVAGLYVGILGRDAEYGGWLFQRNAMAQHGATPHALVANFLESAEFKRKNPNLSNDEFVRLLYRQVLGREPDFGELNFQVANMTSRVNLAVAFLTSDEFKIRLGPRLTGFLLHALLLQRDPSRAELDARAPQIAFGVPLTTIIGQMLPAGP